MTNATSPPWAVPIPVTIVGQEPVTTPEVELVAEPTPKVKGKQLKLEQPTRDLETEINRYKTALDVLKDLESSDALKAAIDEIKVRASLLAAEYFGIV